MNKTTKEINYGWLALPKVFVMSHKLSQSIVDNLNDYLDEVTSSENRTDASDGLVGQIQNGQQNKLDFRDPRVIEYSELSIILCKQYMKKFIETTESKIFSNNLNVKFSSIWSVHSFEGDYNPIHDHGTNSKTGLSTTCWTKVPDQILNRSEANFSKYNSSGDIDGCITFQFDLGASRSAIDLHPPSSITIKPEPGKMLIFPSWLMHSVYPFKGEGERRTVAANFDILEV